MDIDDLNISTSNAELLQDVAPAANHPRPVFARPATDRNRARQPFFSFTPQPRTRMDQHQQRNRSMFVNPQRPTHQKVFNFSNAHTRVPAPQARPKLEDDDGQQLGYSNIAHSNPQNHCDMVDIENDDTQDSVPPGNDTRHAQHYAPPLATNDRGIGARSHTQMPPTPRSPPRRAIARASPAPSNNAAFSDPDDLDFSELLNRKMKEATSVKAQLQEEKRTSATLQAQLATANQTKRELQTSNDDLRAQMEAIESASNARAAEIQQQTERFNTLNSDHEQTKLQNIQLQSELSQIRIELSRNQTERKEMENEVVNIRNVLNQTKQQFSLELKEKTREMDITQKDLVRENDERVERVKHLAKKGLEDLSKRYDALGLAFKHLKTEHDMSLKNADTTTTELIDLRQAVDKGLKGIESVLDHTGRFWSKGAETRTILEELQNDRAGASQVIDMLRSKLQAMGDQLVEAKEYSRTLEHNEDARQKREVTYSSALESLGERIATLLDKVTNSEQRECFLLSENDRLEKALQETKESLHAVTRREETWKEERQALQSDTTHQQATVVDLTSRVIRLSEKLDAAQEAYTSREREIARLTESNDMLQAQKLEMHSSLDVARGEVAKLHVDLGTRSSELEAERKQLKQECKSADEMAKKLKSLECDLERLGADATERENEMHQCYTSKSVLQERFDSEAMILKLTKEHTGDLQEKMVATERSQAAVQERLDAELSNLKTAKEHASDLQEKLVAAERMYTGTLSALQEQNSSFQLTVQRLQDEIKEQAAVLDKTSTDYATRLQKESDAGRALAEAHDKRARNAEQQLTEVTSILAEIREAHAKSSSECDSVKDELEKLRLKATLSDPSLDEVLRSQELAKQIDTLRTENAGLREKETTLEQRYKDGELTNEEKAFVSCVMQYSHFIYEQDFVAKENEIRGRDNLISGLQKKIDNLELTIAKALRQRDKEQEAQNSIVNLKLWPSPKERQIDSEMTQEIPPKQPHLGKELLDSPDRPGALKRSSPAPVKSFAELDAEDDISEHSEFEPPAKPVSVLLGKRGRERPAESRPSRRSKIIANEKMEVAAEVERRQPTATQTKSKTRKRR